MRLRFISILLFSFSSLVSAAGQNFLGDTLSEGQQFASTSFSMSDWYVAADYVNDATVTGIDELDRGFSAANSKGYNFKTSLTYQYGISDNISVGLKYGYIYQKDESNIDGAQGASFEGDWVTEGGTDLTLLGKYRLEEGTSIDVFIDVPICSSSDAEGLCKAKLATLDNPTQVGLAGGQGKSFYRVGGAMSSNWITAMDTHWMGSVFASAAVSDKIDEEKVTAPITYGATFGAIMPIKQNHMWTGTLTLTRMLKYSSYSVQAQDEVKYSAQSSLVLKGEYLWDFMSKVQLRPFAEFGMVQLPTQAFYSDGIRRTIEYTSGSKITIGAELRATF
jgi:hypothetical protein